MVWYCRKLFGITNFRRSCIFALSLLLSTVTATSRAAEQRFLEILPPEGAGNYLISGTVFFNPGELNSTDSIRVLAVPDQITMDIELLFSEDWPGGDGVMCADIAFVATDEAIHTNRYVLEWGNEKRAKNIKVDRSLPVLAFNLGDEVTDDNIPLPVGTVVVKVRKHPEFYYYWYLIPIGAIIGLLLWRKLTAR